MNTMTRRTALAASATLPLLPVASYATPADPAVEAYRVPARFAQRYLAGGYPATARRF